MKAFDHREMRVVESAPAPVSDRGGIGQAFERIERETALLHELIVAVVEKLDPVLRDRAPSKTAEDVRAATTNCAVARGMQLAADRLELARRELASLLDRVDL